MTGFFKFKMWMLTHPDVSALCQTQQRLMHGYLRFEFKIELTHGSLPAPDAKNFLSWLQPESKLLRRVESGQGLRTR